MSEDWQQTFHIHSASVPTRKTVVYELFASRSRKIEGKKQKERSDRGLIIAGGCARAEDSSI